MIRESDYIFRGYKDEPHVIRVTWSDEPDERGIYPVLQFSGNFIACDNFDKQILQSDAFRIGFNQWLHSLI